MTHLIFGTRGILASMNQFIADLTAQRFVWRRKNLNEFLPNGKPNPMYNKYEDVAVQGMLRPIQLWEYIYPEQSPAVPGQEGCEMIDNTQLILKSLDIKGPDHYIPQSIGRYVWLAQKTLGVKPIPKQENKYPFQLPIHLIGISIIPIGVKDDEYRIHDFGLAGKYEQEGI